MDAEPENHDLRGYLDAEEQVLAALRQRHSEIAIRVEKLRQRGRRLADRMPLEPENDVLDGVAYVRRAEERIKLAVARTAARRERAAHAYERAADAHDRAAMVRDRVGDSAGAGAHRDAAARDRARAVQARSTIADEEAPREPTD